MRARRPELFSDSKAVTETHLSRATFEYHLNTLTSRKQEIDFEHFCRLLAERELCPNLLPQTGPTGGGDSKVDAETYPVADAISLRWYEGIGREASQERWAFAFSAKEEWRPKVGSDVEKIVNTKRGYKHIYFITNQFVKDKARAEVEDALKDTHGISVRILDRSWIMKCVFENDRLQLAIDTLNITGFGETTQKVVGPQDVERDAELRELEEQIGEPSRYDGIQYQLGEDCLRAALLARGLERPRTEVDGLFVRAERVAEKVDHPQQRLRISYAKAWTAYWWHDDFSELNRLYDQVEEFAIGSMQATDIELLLNLWQLLSTTVRRGQLDATDSKLDARTTTLKSELDRLATDKERPNNALQARANRLLVDLNEAVGDTDRINTVLVGCKDILAETAGLSDFAVEPFAHIIRELGDILADNEVYDELFESVVSLVEQRTSEGVAGQILLQRGFQKLRAKKRYDAIKLFGRAQQKLAKREFRGELIAALAGCGLAYEAAGLLWAGRANILAAANQALLEYSEHGKIVPQALTCLQKLIWLELQLGRIPYVLAWMEATSMIADHLKLQGKRRDRYTKERETQGRVLGLLFLKSDISQLKSLAFMPKTLEDLDLVHSNVAVIYALGHEDFLRKEGTIPSEENEEAVREIFWKWLNQPVKDDLPERVELLSETHVTLHSFVLGCEIVVKVANNMTSIHLAETFLGTIEALLATSLDQRIVPYRSEFRLNIEPSEYVSGLPQYRVEEVEGETEIEIRHPALIRHGSVKERLEFRDWISELIGHTISQIALIDDVETYMEGLARDELAFARAMNFSEISICIGNILGDAPKFGLSDWEKITKGERFDLKRSIPWHHGLKETNVSEKPESIYSKLGKGEPPEELSDVEHLKHRDRQVFSLINTPLWNKAQWSGTIYATPEDPTAPPLLALGFKDEDAGKVIFKGWRKQLGEIDTDEQLRISIITGIDKIHPASYAVVVSANPKLKKESHTAQLIMISRTNRMVPLDSRNLDRFLKHFNNVGKYFLVPAHFVDVSTQPQLFYELCIGKEELRVCPAWELTENDPDICALRPDDDLIIPDDVTDPPVARVMQRIRDKTG